FQTVSAGMEVYKETIVAALRELLNPSSIIERNDSIVREREGLPLIRQAVYGEAPQEHRFEFRGKTFSFQPLEGQKTGFFLDQRFNAEAAGRFAFGEMLDAFCYVGQFGIHAGTGVSSVTCVDASEAAVEQAKRNAEFNSLHRFEGVCANVFDYLKN